MNIQSPFLNRLHDIYYNEFDDAAASWLEELMKRDLIFAILD